VDAVGCRTIFSELISMVILQTPSQCVQFCSGSIAFDRGISLYISTYATLVIALFQQALRYGHTVITHACQVYL
jgi:hypothetical protein